MAHGSRTRYGVSRGYMMHVGCVLSCLYHPLMRPSKASVRLVRYRRIVVCMLVLVIVLNLDPNPTVTGAYIRRFQVHIAV